MLQPSVARSSASTNTVSIAAIGRAFPRRDIVVCGLQVATAEYFGAARLVVPADTAGVGERCARLHELIVQKDHQARGHPPDQTRVRSGLGAGSTVALEQPG